MKRDASPMLVPRDTPILLDAAPVINQLNSLAALKGSDYSSGLSVWIYETETRLTDELRQKNTLLFGLIGLPALVSAFPPPAALATLDQYTTLLRQQEPGSYRDRCLAAMMSTPLPSLVWTENEPPSPLTDPLSSESTFIRHFQLRLEFGSSEQWGRVFALLRNPEELVTTVANHIAQMWNTFLAPEWHEIAPVVADAVRRLRGVDIGGVGLVEALTRLTGRNIAALITPGELAQFKRIVVIPSLHNGPYISPLVQGETFYLLFGVQPSVAPQTTPLHTNIALNRLKALSDETRMGIMLALQQAGELSTQAIMDRFSLSKSAASRHLRYLQATELVLVDRVDKTKKRYRPNGRAMAETIGFMQRHFAP